MVRLAEDAVLIELTPITSAAPRLALGIAHRELLVNGVTFEAGALSRGLTERLHRRGVGALAFQRGVTAEGLTALFDWLVLDDASPIAPPTVAGITVARVAYDRLGLSNDSPARAELRSLWRALAESALEEGSEAWERSLGGEEDEELSTEQMAQAIRSRMGETEHARRVGVVLGSIVSQVARAPLEVRDALGERLQQVLRRIGDAPMAVIMNSVGAAREQRQFLTAMVDVLPIDSVIEWLEMAGKGANQELSHHLVRVLTKLSVNQRLLNHETGLSPAHVALRESARGVIRRLDLGEVQATDHDRLLERIAKLGSSRPSTSPRLVVRIPDEALTGTTISGPDAEAARLVQIACEIGHAGDDAIAAAETLVEHGHASLLLTWLNSAPSKTTARALRRAATAAGPLTSALRREPFDADAARRLLAATDDSAAPVLLDALAESPSRTVRRLIYDYLRVSGSALLPVLLERIRENPPWYFMRNLISLLRDLGGSAIDANTGSVSAVFAELQSHEETPVRLEVLRLLAEDPTAWDAAVCRALSDGNRRVVTAAIETLASLVQGGKRMSVPLTLRLIDVLSGSPFVDSPLDDSTLVRGVRALRAAPGQSARSWLLSHVSRRTRCLKRLKLVPARPTVAAALEVLRERFANDAAVIPVLRLAA